MKNNQIIVFRLGDESYGLMAHEVKEIDRRREVVVNKVPKTPKHIVGILNLRGEVVPITDLRMQLEIASKSTDKLERVIIVYQGQHLFGMVVDEMLDVQTVLESDFTPPPEHLMAEEPHISSIVRQGQQVIFMLNLKHLFTCGV